ncbi:MAG: TauD/TfdA family dioxygenase [Pseudomonadota bacterium]
MIPFAPGSDPLDNAYQRVRAAPANAEAQLELAIGLIERGRLDEARRHAIAAAEHASPDWENLAVLGTVLFELGVFPEAHRILIQAAQLKRIGAAQLRMLAALYHHTGDVDLERHCLKAMATLEAVVGPQRIHPGKPHVLRLRSVENSYFGVKINRQTGLRFASLKGGHFSLKNLADSKRMNRYIGTVFGDNLNGLKDLPDFDLFINCVGCADRDPGGLERIRSFVNRHPEVPVINAPDKVLRTTRADNAIRLNEIGGVVMPQTKVFTLERSAEAVAASVEEAGFDFPVIVRQRGTQTGKTVEKIDSRPDLLTWIYDQPMGAEIHVISWLDCAWDDGYFHKTRVFFIDDVFYPVANLSSDFWQIHSGDRYRVMSETPSTQEEEKRFLSDPRGYLGAKAYDALHGIRDAIDLDFFGIDFTLDAEGNVLVFEANAAMRHNFDHAGTFPYTRPYLETISQAFGDMIDRRVAERNKTQPAPRPTQTERPASPASSPIPTVKLAAFMNPIGNLTAHSGEQLIAELIERLSKPPYWLMLSSGQMPIDLTWVNHVLETLGAAGRPPGAEPPHISRTRVRINPNTVASTAGKVTRYSRTPDALPLHTDCSNLVTPPNVVAFAMERPDAHGGGESVMLSAVDLVEELPSELSEFLRRPEFPFSPEQRFAILEGDGDSQRIRYYRNQIISGSAGQNLSDDLIAALDQLDRHLDAAENSVRFHMRAGDVVIMDNTRVMHGRDSMAPDSQRLMHRFRLTSPAVAARDV